MVMRVNQVAAEFRKVSNKQMAETTKRTIRENVSINAQLGKMSDKTMELITVQKVMHYCHNGRKCDLCVITVCEYNVHVTDSSSVNRLKFDIFVIGKMLPSVQRMR